MRDFYGEKENKERKKYENDSFIAIVKRLMSWLSKSNEMIDIHKNAQHREVRKNNTFDT